MEHIDWSESVETIEYTRPEEYCEQLAIEFLENAQRAVAEKGSFLAVLGGGRTPRQINAKIIELSSNYHVDWSRVYIFLSDERWIEETSDHSNYKMMQETLAGPLGIDCLYHIYEQGKTAMKAAEKYAAYLEEIWEKTGQTTFDYMLLGVGNDGHTASLFPGVHHPAEGGQMVVCGGKGPEGLERISLSYATLNKCDRISFLVNNPEKIEILRKMKKEWAPDKFPIQNITVTKCMYILSEQ